MFLITCKSETDEYEVRADSRDIYVWEKTGRGRTLKGFMEDLSISALYEIAHIASKRTQQFTGSLDEFSKAYELDFEEEHEAADPTPPDHTREL